MSMEGVELDDATLVGRVLAGDREAFRPLALRYGPRVGALCLGMLRQPSYVVEDLAQEAFVKAWRALGTLVDHERFGSWLLGIARNLCLDWLRRRRTGGAPLPLADDGGGVDPREPGDALEAGEERLRIREAVDRLPEKYREVIYLRYYAQAGYEEIARALDLTPAGVNQRLTRARARLRQSLARAGLAGEGEAR